MLFEKLFNQWWSVWVMLVFILLIWTVLSILFYRSFYKRLYDIILSGLALILLSPLLLTLIIIGAIKMKGNPFFVQMRPGRVNKKTGNEKIFKLIKFRSMSCEVDENGNLLPDEKRLTKYGKFLRSTSLDELPELFNIFIGDMSIIGPRPQLVVDMVFMTPEQRKRHVVRPGLTGLAQISGRNRITWEQKIEYDLQYIKDVSFVNDLKILFLTPYKVLKQSDVERDGTVSDVNFGDWLLRNGEIDEQEYLKKIEESKKIKI